MPDDLCAQLADLSRFSTLKQSWVTRKAIELGIPLVRQITSNMANAKVPKPTRIAPSTSAESGQIDGDGSEDGALAGGDSVHAT